MPPRTRPSLACLAILSFSLTLSLLLASRADAGYTYLAIGDSVAFGETDFTHNPSNGDRGYVSLFANALTAANGGVSPNVVNLAVDGETTTSFISGAAFNTAGGPNANLINTNYPNATTAQNTLMQMTIVAQPLYYGNSINYVTVSLGANDLYTLVSNPTFFTESTALQTAQLTSALTTVQNNYTTILTELKTELPSAQVFLLGYYNPFVALTGTAIAAVSPGVVQALNAVIAGEAKAFGYGYVDNYTPFLGKEATDTYILTNILGAPDIHPNAAGYQIIADQLITTAGLPSPASVPEPGSFVLIGLGLAGLAARGFSRRRGSLSR